MADTKKHWRDLVDVEDLDAHMFEVGQAAVNADLIKKMISQFPLQADSTLYVPGCGTGQMFDFLKPSDLGKLNFIFSDYKPEFLEKLKNRLPSGTKFQTLLDDVEESELDQKADAALIVLLLEHVDWKRALDNILKVQPEKIFLIIQEQDATDSMINKNRQLRPSMKKFSEIAKTELVDRKELERYLNLYQFQLQAIFIETVPHTKRMVALVFNK